MKTHIKSLNDFEAFFKLLHETESLNFQPDERIENYVQNNTNVPTYTPEVADLRNKLMESCFEICDLEGVNTYEIGLTQLFNKLKS